MTERNGSRGFGRYSAAANVHVGQSRVRLKYLPYQTLIRAHGDDDLTTWFMSTKRVDLDRRERYLLVSPTGGIAWVALNKTRLTQFGTGLSNDSFTFAGETIRLSFSAVDSPVRGDVNIELRLRLKPLDEPVLLRAWFDVVSLELRHVEGPDLASPGSLWIQRQVKRRKQQLMAALARRLMRPFKYVRNRAGRKASQFLGTQREYFKINLHRRGNLSFFSVE